VLHFLGMTTISQRQLRNENATIVDRVVAGESFTVTRRGEPVARLVPISKDDSRYLDSAGLRLVKPAKRKYDPANHPKVVIDEPSQDVLDRLREDRI